MDIVEPLKVAGPIITIIIPLIALCYNMYFKVKNITDFDKIFINKEDVHKINFMHSVFRCLLYIFIFYLSPSTILAVSYHSYDPKDDAAKFDGWPALLLMCIFILFSIFILITIIVNLCSIQTKMKLRRVNLIFSSLALISSMFLYPFVYYAFIYGDKSLDLIYFIICFPIVISMMIVNIHNFYNNKMNSSYLIEILDKDTLSKLSLIHSHTLNDNTTILYEKGKSIEEEFYFCNFASNVYLKYIKNTVHLTQNN
ncbi:MULTISPECIES: hypothetical protein [Bacillus cereus group]|uniref:Uncharacterized protein n=1 Tax=Bacillus cereus TaxID=1396 RepID=A0A1T2PX21_BACCE|nr:MULTISPECIES: hypothetical protein [Bacillus cereus group]OOZ86413.1 hypothetical protein BHL25_15710 [Bacillus cereus]PHA21277.1 hypothetical protein COE70_12975 [Bacillus cereus]PHG83925.1 hypothetical protein COI69_03880 [Bacillus cereus]SME68429.1 hypothetical protein BACERE00198_00122 [Bacillus cereus]